MINDIGTALRFVEEDFGTRTEDLTSLLQNAEITWDLVWALFPPKEEIIAPHHGELAQDQAGYLSYASYKENPATKEKWYEATVKIIHHDGSDFGWAHLSIKIPQYDGAKKITSLSAYPFSYLPDPEAMRKQLISRGRRYVQIIKAPVCQEYMASMAVRLDRTSRQNVHVDPNNVNRRIKIAVWLF